jgi:hypothetical protein
MTHVVKFDLSNPIVTTRFNYTPEQEKVIRDLETTRTKQTRKRLYHRSKGFCCLGRFCLVSGSPKTSLPGAIYISFDDTSTVLPPSMVDLLKVNSQKGNFVNTIGNKVKITVIKRGKEFPNMANLTDLNDTAKLNFKEIARFIKQFPHLVFTNRRRRKR